MRLEMHVGTLMLMVGIPMAVLVVLGIHWMQGHCARCLKQPPKPEEEPKKPVARQPDKGAYRNPGVDYLEEGPELEPPPLYRQLRMPLKQYDILSELGPEGLAELQHFVKETWYQATFEAAGTLSLTNYRKIVANNDEGGQIAMLRNRIYELNDGLTISFVK